MSATDDGLAPDELPPGPGRLPRAFRPPSREAPRPWAPNETADRADANPGSLGALVTFHYLRAAVRRRLLRCLLAGIIGLLLAGIWLWAVPTSPTASVTIMLAHDVRADPVSAMTTDVGLLTTRTVADRTVQRLGLSMSPEALLASVTVVPPNSNQLLEITMTAPNEGETLRRLDRFTSEYLAFRAQQVSAQSNEIIKGYQDRVDDLQKALDAVETRIDSVHSSGDTGQRLTDAVTQRSQLTDAIGVLQDKIQQTELQRDSVVRASMVIDPPALLKQAGLRHTLLVLVSGLLLGLAAGVGLAVVQGIVSDRLWLRVEVASALEAPVPLGVRRLAPLARVTRPLRALPPVRAADGRRRIERQRFAEVIGRAVLDPRRRTSLIVLCIRNSDEVSLGVVEAAVLVRRQGVVSTIVDLTEESSATRALGRLRDIGLEDRPHVFRPAVVPSLMAGPAGLDVLADDLGSAPGSGAATIVLADVNPAVGVDHLAAWAGTALVAVSAGRSSAELVRTTGQMVRSAGLDLVGGVVLRSPRDDVSMGLPTMAVERGRGNA